MADGTTHRVLRLLGLLQARRTWTGPELAAELGVTDRCVRRDVARLRELGYPVNASQGVGGGYQLGAGTALPPLLLDSDEAIATTLSLLLAAGGTVTGAADATLRTLAKLDQVLPPRLRAEVRAIAETTAILDRGGTDVDGGDLMLLARATRDRLRVRFAYERADGSRAERDVEPSGIVATGRWWYLLAWDTARDDWRTFRVDRLSALVVTTWRCARPAHPDPAAYVQGAVTTAPYRHRARVRVALPPERLRTLVGPGTASVEADAEPGWSLLVAGADDLDWMALRLAEIDAPLEVLEPPELRTTAARLAERLRAMAGSAG
ncbi:YafY family transcriptional regulator [Nocardioides sp. ChNu-153]|uniref:helix-turn-helix transcriptional regulator n=1 Tax=unclassified Nocardioides TaxID=2615069 RepID=UPI002406B096|nr:MULTISPECIES: YafY family protein [unclassified Nocardioides]MDF9715722.1 YafY family transcriptional regulator [Nocardioides sp. ChNu-99]MDN7121827.1 YafY family transcriptional regulator [Nocardioides sp. ChNu-153]